MWKLIWKYVYTSIDRQAGRRTDSEERWSAAHDLSRSMMVSNSSNVDKQAEHWHVAHHAHKLICSYLNEISISSFWTLDDVVSSGQVSSIVFFEEKEEEEEGKMKTKFNLNKTFL